jgi:cytochrome c-type biogenesis protein CcsB
MIGYWISLSIPQNQSFFAGSQLFIYISNLLFAGTLAIRWIREGYFPLSNLYESLIFLSWGISTIQLFLEDKTKSRLIGAIGTPLIFFLAGFSSLTLPTEMQKSLPLVPSLQSNWLMMHVSMMMISYSTLIIGSLLSILYLAFLNFITENKKINLQIQNQESLVSAATNSKISPSVNPAVIGVVRVMALVAKEPLLRVTDPAPATSA